MNTTKGIFSKKSDEWETPQDLFVSYDLVYHFTLDPCATSDNAKCERYYTIVDDGLTKSWKDEVVWCNPPYSKCYEWVQKAYMESITNGAKVVMLLPVRTDTKWFHHFVIFHSKIVFIRGRLRFGNSNSNAPFPSMIVIFGEE